MEQLKVFQGFKPEQLRLLRPLFTAVDLPAGEPLFKQGEPAECFYILAHGDVVIRYKPEDGPVLDVIRVRSEGVVGWSAAIGSPHYTSSAICSTNCRVLQVRIGPLRQLCEADPNTGSLFLERIAALIEARLRSNHPQLMALLEEGLSIKLDRPALAS